MNETLRKREEEVERELNITTFSMEDSFKKQQCQLTQIFGTASNDVGSAGSLERQSSRPGTSPDL
jgi:hypothetical protein